MSFRNAGRARRAVKRLAEEVAATRAALGILQSQLAGLPAGLAQVRVEMANMFPGRGTPQEQMNALLGLPAGTPAGSGMSAGPATALPVSPGIFIPADFSPEAQQRRQTRAGGWNEQAAADIIARLTELKARLERVFGGPTYIGQIIETEIKNIQAKVLTPDEALAFIRYILSTMSAGLQQEALSPVAEIRQVASDLLRFAGGAALPGGAGALAPGPRALPPAPAESPVVREVVAGIGTAVQAAVRNEVAGLGATISQRTTEQTRQITGVIQSRAATPSQIADAVRNRMSPDLRRFYDQAARFAAENQRQISMALERLQVSGTLSGNT